MIALVFGFVIVAMLIAGIALSRQQKDRKEQAIADLQREKEQIGQHDIFALIEEEIGELGLRDIEGAEGIPSGVLLKAWRDNSDVVDGCVDRTALRFVVADGVEPAEANDPDVTLVCDAQRDEQGDTPS